MPLTQQQRRRFILRLVGSLVIVGGLMAYQSQGPPPRSGDPYAERDQALSRQCKAWTIRMAPTLDDEKAVFLHCLIHQPAGLWNEKVPPNIDELFLRPYSGALGTPRQ